MKAHARKGRKLVLKMSVSVDGFVCGLDNETDWIHRTIDDKASEWVSETIENAGAHVVGRKTFCDMAAYFPISPDLYAEAMNSIPKIVFSTKGALGQNDSLHTTRALADKLRDDDQKKTNKRLGAKYADTWQKAGVFSNIEKDISALKLEPGRYLLAHGGASFAQALIRHGLIDEYRLVIHPVILGKGKPLFAQAPESIYLKLESSIKFPSGILGNIYTPVYSGDAD